MQKTMKDAILGALVFKNFDLSKSELELVNDTAVESTETVIDLMYPIYKSFEELSSENQKDHKETLADRIQTYCIYYLWLFFVHKEAPD